MARSASEQSPGHPAKNRWLALLLTALGGFLLVAIPLLVRARATPSWWEQSPRPARDESARPGQVATQDPARKSWLKSPLVTGLGGFLLAAVPVIGLIASPWFQEHWDPPNKSVSLGVVCLESGVTEGSYDSARHEQALYPSLPGLYVTIALTANGFDGGYIYMKSDVLNAISGVEALGPLESQAEERQIPVNASTVVRDPEIWVPLPATTGKYVVQIRVMDGDLPGGNQGLAEAYSPLFALRSGDRIAMSGLCTG